MSGRPAILLAAAWLLAAGGGLPSAGGGVVPTPPPAAVAAVAGTGAWFPGAAEDQLSPADPFPIRRVLVPPDRLAAVVPPAGGLRRLPRDEFEGLVRRAAAAVATGPPPRLVRAHYRAALTETGLTGSGEWRVASPGAAAGPIPLDPLRTAVWNPRWPDGRPALLYHTSGGPAATLWVDGPDPGAVAFDWSARGAEEPGDLRFDLRLPPAPVATLDLDLPAGRVPVPAQSDVLVTGPLPGPGPDRAGWRVAFGGQSRVEFTVRGPDGAGPLPPLTKAALTARFDLAPGQAEARYEFDLETVRGPADGWEFDVDPALRVIDAAANGRESWRVTPAAGPGQPARLAVRLREPVAGGRVVITAVAPFPTAGEPWACPAVRPVAAAAGEEVVELRLGPDLRLDAWDPGDYRPAQAAATPDRGYGLAFRGTLTAADTPARRPPAVRARAAGPEFATTEAVEWRIDPAGSRLTGRVRVRVLRGPLAQIAVRVPAGYDPEPAGAMPDDPAATAGLRAVGLWVAEPSRPLAAGDTAEVVIVLRGPPGPPPADPAGPAPGRAAVPFPRLAPVGADTRDGTFTVTAAPAYRAWPSPSAAGQEGPAGTAFTVRYAGDGPEGVLTLAPRPPRVAVDGETAVSLVGDRLTATTRLRPRAEGGEVGQLTVFTPDPPGGWEWSVSAPGADVRPDPAGSFLRWLPAFAGAGFPVGPVGQVWRVSSPRPARVGVEVVARADRRVPHGTGAVSVPVPAVLGAEQPALPVTLDAPAATRFDTDPAAGPAGQPLVRTVPLRPRGATPDPDPGHGWRFAAVTVTTRVTEGGGVVGVLAGRVIGAVGGAVPVELPAGAVVETATVDGRWADVEGAPPKVRLPVPTPGPVGAPFELRYRLPSPISPPAARVASPAPGLPGVVGDVRRVWAVGPGYRLWPTLAEEDGPQADTALVVDARVPVAVGFAAAAAFVGWGVGLLVGHARRTGWALLVGSAAGLGAAAGLVPDGWQSVVRPPLVAALAAVVVGAVRARPGGGRPGRFTPPAAAALLAVGAAAVAQAPGPAVVYLVPGPGGGPTSVLAPQPVLDRLAGLTAPALPPVVVTAAEYDGRVVDGAAAFEAKFAVHCTADGEHTLTLPLTGVRLERMLLDGAAAYPEARPDGLAVAVAGRGRHDLTARFAAPVVAAGADREVKFGTPDVPAARLTFAGGAAARQVVVPTRRGDQRAASGPAGSIVRADLGGGRALAVRWRAGGPVAGRQVVTVTEGCVWDLGEDDAEATAAFVYRVEQGSLARVRIDLPPGVEPGRVAVRPLDAAAGAAANGVKNWSLEPAADGWQAFTVEPQVPVEGRVAVTFRLYPRRPPAAHPTLRFPRAADTAAASAYYGVRLHGVAAEGWEKEKAGLIDFPADKVAREFAGVPEFDLDKRPPALAFRREGTGPPHLRPTLSPPTDPRPVGYEIVWHPGPHPRAEGTVRWARDVSLSRVGFDVPGPVAVSDVRADGLVGWSQAGTRVQVWLRAAVAEPVVRWSGAMTDFPASPARPSDPVRVDLPFPPGAGEGVSARVRPADGWVAVVAGGQPAGGRDLTFTPVPGAPPPRVLLYPPPAAPWVRVWQTAESTGGDIAWRAAVVVGPRANRPRAFTLRVGDLPPGADVRLDLPAGAAAAEVPAGGGARAWTVTVPADGAVPNRVTVSARLPGRPVVTLPAVDALFAGVPPEHTTRWVMAGPEFRPANPAGLWETEDRGGWPDDLARVRGAVWRVAGAEAVRFAWAGAGARDVRHPAAVTPPEPAPAPAPGAGWLDPDAGRWLAAAGWVLGLGLVGGLIRRGPAGWWPEYWVLLGLVAAAAAGPGFLAVSVVGGLARVGGLGRRVARVVLR